MPRILRFQFPDSSPVREVLSTGKIVATEEQNYGGPGIEPSWTGELSGNWKRNILGIDGALRKEGDSAGTGEEPILQLSNLHGDVIATAHDSEASTSLESMIRQKPMSGSVPAEVPPKYSWLGSHELPTQLPSGATVMGTRAYIPQLGRFLQTDPSPGGSANAYAYTYGDPLNETDLSGNETSGGLSAVGSGEGFEL